MAAITDEVWKSSSLAAVYLEGIRGAIPLAQEQLDVMVRLLAGLDRPLRRFLDIGCGDGILAAAILNRFPEATGLLIDFSQPMLDAAQTRLVRYGDAAQVVNVDYGESKWTKSVAPNGPYDAIVSGFSIHHQEDTRKQEIYLEIFDLLEPGGIFINVEHVRSSTDWVRSVHDNLFVDRLVAHHPEKSRQEIEETYYRRPAKEANILAPVEQQCQWLGDIGYIDVDCYLKIFELAVFGGRKP